MRTLVFHHEKNLNRNNFEFYLHFDFAFLKERISIFRQRFGIWKKKKTFLISVSYENRSKIAILFASERCGKQLSSLLFSSRTGLLSHHLENRKIGAKIAKTKIRILPVIPASLHSASPQVIGKDLKKDKTDEKNRQTENSRFSLKSKLQSAVENVVVIAFQ